jgi:hypothetical protein
MTMTMNTLTKEKTTLEDAPKNHGETFAPHHKRPKTQC